VCVCVYVCIQEGGYARKINASIAFFIHDALSLMDRGFVFTLIKTYLKKVRLVVVVVCMLILCVCIFFFSSLCR